MSDEPLPECIGLAHFDPRVSAITPQSRRFLQTLGAWDAIDNYRHCAYRHMTVWDGQGSGQVEFDCAEVGAEFLGHIVENRAIVHALQKRLKAAVDVTPINPSKLASCSRGESGDLLLELDKGEQIVSRLVVGADGAMSRVRSLMNFDTREWDYGHRAIVTTVEVEKPHNSTALQRFLSTGPLAFLPLPGEFEHHYCSIVWSVEEALADELLALDDTAFCKELGAAFEYRLGEVVACSPRFAFPLRQRHAKDYVQAGIALVGDAAHTIHPLAGQGINLGLQDVAVLSEEILSAASRGTNPGQLENLRRYQRRRKGQNLLMMAAMDGLKRVFEPQSLPLRWLRNTGMRALSQFAPLKKQLMRHAMGLGE